jgi:hypothetical protein
MISVNYRNSATEYLIALAISAEGSAPAKLRAQLSKSFLRAVWPLFQWLSLT